MLLEHSAFSVDKRWYRLFWAIIVVANILLALIYVVFRFVLHNNQALSSLGMHTEMLVLTGISLVYLISGFWIIQRRNLALAAFIGSLTTAIVLLDGLSHSDPNKAAFLYVSIWLVLAFFNGMYGLQMLVAGMFLTFVYALLQSDFVISSTSMVSTVLVGLALITIISSYFFWRKHIKHVEEQKFTQLASMLRSNQQQSEVLLQALADGIIVTDLEGRVTIMNPAASSMTEWESGEARNVDVQAVVKLTEENGDEIPAEENPFGLVMSRKQHINKILQLKGRGGKKTTISLVISPLIEAAGTLLGAIAVIRDITEERKAEQQRADFISTASHEMRTPVAAIEGYLELALNEKVSTIDTRAHSFLVKAQASTQHLGRLFQDLLTSSRAEDGRLSSFPVPVEMASFVQQATDSVRFSAEKKHLAVEFLLGNSNEATDANTSKDAAAQHMLKPLYYALIDPDRLREVITNLFDNACKYTDRGKITIGLTADANTVQVYVHDTGAGIPPDDIPHLFQKFYRVDNSATRTIGGTGLGLFICRKIIELYHGHIWVQSVVGQGSTFFISLPRLSAQQAAALQPATADDSREKLPST